MGTVAESVVELEAMKKEDSSWHPCQVSLSSGMSTGFGLIVDFGSDGSQDIINTKEEALARLRIRSTALQGDDCLNIAEGLHVLANQGKEPRMLLFDAEVEKVHRVRHSKRVQCRCTFVVRWLQSDLKGETMIVPSSSIMKQGLGNIDNHPTVSSFLNLGKALNYSSVFPFSSLLEETVSETDLSRVVEKQIEEIGKLADESKKGCSEEILFVFKKGKTREVNFLCEQASQIQNNCRRTTRSQNKTQLEAKHKNPPIPESNRHHLSPLGARAALASLMSKLPQEAEFSICHLDTQEFAKKSLSTPDKDSNSVSLDMAELLSSGSYLQQKVSTTENLFPRLEACPDQLVSENTNNTKLTDALHESSLMKGSRGKQRKFQKPESVPDGEYSNTNNVEPSSTCSISNTKKNNSMMPTRLTRSAFQKGIVSNDEMEVGSSVAQLKLITPVRATRLTGSMIEDELEMLTVEVKQGLGKKEPAQNARSDSAKGDIGMRETKGKRRKKPVSSSPLNTKMNFNAAQENKKPRVSDDIRITNKHAGEVDGIQCVKRKSSNQVKKTISKKPELRLSPRLRFLPRTRSQKS